MWCTIKIKLRISLRTNYHKIKKKKLNQNKINKYKEAIHQAIRKRDINNNVENYINYVKLGTANFEEDSIIYDVFYWTQAENKNCGVDGPISRPKLDLMNSIEITFPMTFTYKEIRRNDEITKMSVIDTNCVNDLRDVNSSVNLTRLLQTYFGDEDITDFKCQNISGNLITQTQTHTVTKTTKVCTLPKILIITFKRFGFYEYRNPFKINKKVNCPDELDMNPYLVDFSPDRGKDNMYELYGLVKHGGTITPTGGGGHYVAYCKVNNDNDTWVEFNDGLEPYVVNKTKINSTEAYAVFYKKKDIN